MSRSSVDEDKTQVDGDCVGLFHRSVYGCRMASPNWMREWQDLLTCEQYTVGTANPALYFNAVRKHRGALQGDDFVVVGPPEQFCLDGILYASRIGWGSEKDASAARIF